MEESINTEHAKKDSTQEHELHRPNGTLNLSAKNLQQLPSPLPDTHCLVSLNLNYNAIKSLPEDISSTFTNLRYLYVKGNELEALPYSVGCLKKLAVLDASENSIARLPESIADLHCLEKLMLISNRLKRIPEVPKLSALSELHLDENQIKRLPESLGELQQLQRLEVPNNALKSLPKDIGNLRRLKYLNLSYNQVTELPESFAILPNLVDLDVSHNKIERLPDELASAPRLRQLYADSNFITFLPDWLKNVHSLERLCLKNNQLHSSPFPPDFGNVCAKLRSFNLAANFMTSLPETFGRLSMVEEIHLGSTLHELERRNFQNGNWISKLPENFGCLAGLRHLRLDENQLTELPDSFGELSCLETLDLGQNMLRRLPENFGQLRSLRSCLFSKNFLECLPDSFGELKSLTELRLDNNLLASLPESFSNLTQLSVLDLFNNQLTEIPPCLAHLSNLGFLDIDENNFGIPIEDIPRIVFKRTYAKRSPAFRDNWRGKNSENDYTKPKNTKDDVNSDHLEEEVPEKNTMVGTLTSALQQGSAIWKSHGDSKRREKFDHRVQEDRMAARHQRNETAPTPSSNDTNENDSDSRSSVSNWDEELDGPDEDLDEYNSETEENAELDLDETVKDDHEEKLNDTVVVAEDWDAEIENSHPFNVYDDFSMTRKPKYVYDAKQSTDVFCPGDLHETPILRHRWIPKFTVCGQFDDADN